MRLNRPQSPHSNTNCPPLPENAGTYLSKPFEHPNTNQNSGSNPSILRKSFAKAPSFFLKHGANDGKQGLFCSQRPYFLAPPRGGVCCMAAHRVGGRMGASQLRMKDEKSGAIRKGSGQLPFRGAGCPSQPPLSSPFPPRRPTKWRTRRHKKRPRRESTPLMGIFLAAGESRKKSFCAYKPREAARASAQRSPSMAAETMPPA